MAIDSLTGIYAALARIGDEEWTLREALALARAGVFEGEPSGEELRDRIRRVLPRETAPWRDTPEGREEHRRRVYAGLGSLRGELTPSEDFALEKQAEIDREDRHR